MVDDETMILMVVKKIECLQLFIILSSLSYTFVWGSLSQLVFQNAIAANNIHVLILVNGSMYNNV